MLNEVGKNTNDKQLDMTHCHSSVVKSTGVAKIRLEGSTSI